MRWYDRLKRSGEIAFVRRRGEASARATLVAYTSPGRGRRMRVAVTVSKAVGKAVVRNLVRRRIAGALDASAPHEAGLRLLIVAKPTAADASFAALAGDVAAVLDRVRSRPRPSTAS